MLLNITRRQMLSYVCFIAGSAHYNISLSNPAVQKISGKIYVSNKTDVFGQNTYENLVYSSSVLKIDAFKLVEWTIENTTMSIIMLTFQGLRSNILHNGKKIHGTSISLPAGQVSIIQFKATDAGSFLIQLSQSQNKTFLTSALPMVVQDHSLKLEQDISICLYSQSDNRHNTQFFMNMENKKNYSFKQGEIIRFRLYNGTKNSLLMFRFQGAQTRVIALDGHAIEPYIPFQSSVSLSPGQRSDVVSYFSDGQIQDFLIDTQLGSQNLKVITANITPTSSGKIELNNFYKLPVSSAPIYYDLAQSIKYNWNTKSDTEEPAFTVKKGQTVVLSLDNTEEIPQIVKFEAIVARPLDTLDDGVKPYVRDASFLKPNSRSKFAFIPELEGHWKILVYSIISNGSPRILTYFVTA